MLDFVEDIFYRVDDLRDLNYRFGKCHCDVCTSG